MSYEKGLTRTCFFWAISAVLAHALPGGAASLETVPTAAAISAEIEANGAEEVVKRLWNTHLDKATGRSDWDRVADQIWQGRVAYIQLVPKLAEGTDAGPSEDLGISLAHALPIAPDAVLRVTDLNDNPVTGVSRVCGVPFLEGTAIDLPNFLMRAKSAIGRLKAPELQQIKAACLEKLRGESKSYPLRKGQ